MKYVFRLTHTQEFIDGREVVRVIGIYSTKKEAENGCAKVSKLPGFKDYIDGFYIERYEINLDHWIEGYYCRSVSDEYKDYLLEEEGKDCFDKILELSDQISQFKKDTNMKITKKYRKDIEAKIETLYCIIKIIFTDKDDYNISFKIQEHTSKEIINMALFILKISRLSKKAENETENFNSN